MALALTNKTSGTSTTSPGTTASVAFANAKLYICSVTSVAASGNTCDTQVPTGGGLTWVQVAKTNTSRRQVAVYCGYVASGATTGTLSIAVTSGSLARMRWSVEEVTGSAATAANNGSDAFGTPGYEQETAAQTTTSVTIGSFADATNNVALGFVGVAANVSITIDASPAGYVALSNVASTGLTQLVEYLVGQDTTVTSSGFASNTVVATAVELKAAVTTITGTGAIAAPHTTLGATGTERIIGTGAVADPHTTLGATGTERIIGTGAVTDPHSVLGATGAERISGTSGFADLHSVLGAVGVERIIGSGAVTDFPTVLAGIGGGIISGAISQTAPAFTQALVGTSDTGAQPTEPGLGGGVFIGPGFLKARVRVKIRQDAPAFTQSLSAEVNDDELILLLVL